MAISEIDIKLLWGRSAARCNICRIQLTHLEGDGTHKGEQAHIIGENKGSARYDSILDKDARNSYPNLILLCPNHHKDIDKVLPQQYPPEVLHDIKIEHERWVEATLSPADRWKNIEDLVYAQAAQVASTNLLFERWTDWTSMLLQGTPQLFTDTIDGLVEFTTYEGRVPFSGKRPKIEYATKLLSLNAEVLKLIFQSNCELVGGVLTGSKSYKSHFGTEYGAKLSNFYAEWENAIIASVVHLTKAANYFADTIRAEINPAFFLLEGKFQIELGNRGINSYFVVPQFSSDEIIKEGKEVENRLSQLPERLENYNSLVNLWSYDFSHPE
ncbi:MAG: HNH endonuclease signature motif containing protein [Fimbriimonadaceae bacterium]